MRAFIFAQLSRFVGADFWRKRNKNIPMLSAGIFYLIFVSPISFANTTIKPIEHWKTQNNVPVYFVKATEIPMVDIRMVFSAGAAYDHNRWGLAQLANSLLGEGTKTLSSDQISDKFSSIGAEFSQNVNRDFAYLNVRTLIKQPYFEMAVGLFSDVIARASFSETVFNRMKNQTKASLELEQQDAYRVALNAIFTQLYPGLPYGHPVMGTLKTVNSLKMNEVMDFYKRYYVSANAKLLIVGDLTVRQAHQISEKITSALLLGKPVEKLPRASRVRNKPKKVRVSFPAKQDTVIIGQVGMTRANKNYFPLFVGNYILGGRGLSSLLYNELRNRHGLVYVVGSRFIPLQLRGPFYIALQVQNIHSKQASFLAKKTLNHFIEFGPTKTQVQRAKKSLVNGFPLSIATNRQMISVLTNIVFYDLPLNYLNQYQDYIRQVSAKQIRTAFQTTVHPKDFITVIVGNKKTIKEQP